MCEYEYDCIFFSRCVGIWYLDLLLLPWSSLGSLFVICICIKILHYFLQFYVYVYIHLCDITEY